MVVAPEGNSQRLPNAQVRGQHRECCALRGRGWGKRHSTVDYVFTYSPAELYAYHVQIMEEFKRRKLGKIDPLWKIAMHRGKRKAPWMASKFGKPNGGYSEHDDVYLHECVENLKAKVNRQ